MTLSVSPRVQQLVNGMSLSEKAGQIFIFTFVDEVGALLDLELNPGGYIRIYSDALTMTRQHRKLQERTRVPLFIAADFERGIGSTVGGAIDVVTMMCLGAADGESITYKCARAIADGAFAMGVNMNYVPVLDVSNNPANPIINIRSFGADPQAVARHGLAFMRATQDAGIAACGKHFPGHGDTEVDSHTTHGSINSDRQRLEDVELIPFKAAIAAGIDSIMTAHLMIPALDPAPLPATLSPRILEFLREELGFEGLIVSDALEMGGITKHFTFEDAILRALNAGCDQLIMPTNNRRAVQTVIDAVNNGTLSESRLDEAVTRNLLAKEKRGILDATYPTLTEASTVFHSDTHYQTALDAARAGITLVQGSDNLPLDPTKKASCITFSNFDDGRSYFLEPKSFGNHLRNQGIAVETVHCGTVQESNVHEFNITERALKVAGESDIIILAAYVKVVINAGNISLPPHIQSFVHSLLNLGKPVVLVSFGSPYLIRQFPQVQTYVCGYGATEATQQATAELLAGKYPWRGKLPVPLD